MDDEQLTVVIRLGPETNLHDCKVFVGVFINLKQLQSWVDQLSSLKEAFILVKENIS